MIGANAATPTTPRDAGWRVRVLRWTADLEDDLADPGRLRVFVPSLMGAGILVSFGLVVTDLARRMRGRGGAARRRRTVHQRALRRAAPMFEAAGVPPPRLPGIRRRLRRRSAYGLIFTVAATLGLYVAVGSTDNYLTDRGPFGGEVWMQLVATAASGLFLAVAAVSFAVLVGYPRVPRWARWAIDRSVLGVPEP